MWIKYPWSFVVILIVGGATCTLVVVWSFAHIVVLLITIGLLVLLRAVSLAEGRHSALKQAGKLP